MLDFFFISTDLCTDPIKHFLTHSKLRSHTEKEKSKTGMSVRVSIEVKRKRAFNFRQMLFSFFAPSAVPYVRENQRLFRQCGNPLINPARAGL